MFFEYFTFFCFIHIMTVTSINFSYDYDVLSLTNLHSFFSYKLTLSPVPVRIAFFLSFYLIFLFFKNNKFFNATKVIL